MTPDIANAIGPLESASLLAGWPNVSGGIESTCELETNLTVEREEHNVLVAFHVMESASGIENPFLLLA